MTRRVLTTLLIAGGILMTGCEKDKSTSPAPGASEKGAGEGYRGGANDGTAAGKTGSANTAGGNFNNGKSPAETPTTVPPGKK
jgi:hypothetical protein